MDNAPMVRVAKKTQVFANPTVGTKPGWRLQLSEQLDGTTVETQLGTANQSKFGRMFNVKLAATSLDESTEPFALDLSKWVCKEKSFVNEHGENKTALHLYPIG